MALQKMPIGATLGWRPARRITQIVFVPALDGLVQRLVYPARSRRARHRSIPARGGFGRWRAARWPHQFAVRLAHRSTSARTSAFDISPSRRLFQAGKISTVKTTWFPGRSTRGCALGGRVSAGSIWGSKASELRESYMSDVSADPRRRNRWGNRMRKRWRS
jgi:hypothetical protein